MSVPGSEPTEESSPRTPEAAARYRDILKTITTSMQPQETNLVGLLADSYKKAEGLRRVVEMSKNGRKILEFSTYGPKAFASTKRVDPDLEDRCIRIPMTRTRKRLSDREGWERVWAELRDALYRFAMAAFKE